MIPVITIDGPSGSGKGTISKLLSKKLGWHYLESGVLYRAMALSVIKERIDLKDIKALEKMAHNFHIEFKNLNKNELYTEKCGKVASLIAAIPEVRNALIKRQRDFRIQPGLVADGRDMGTVIFPDASLKIFLSASLRERAKRRFLQLQENGIRVSLPAVSNKLAERDARDEKRKISPMKPADDAITIDTSDISINEVLHRILQYGKEKGVLHC